ncbi:hypothetical protein [Streptomyces sp. JJ36]|uniref:hypothetical protein n=1 Tax=Streptomyces sp. JJ36 TaxID=2736645 RepID=UPI001F1C712B|nr:hypothetical protein [Streptomyces sp. JJ36]MCF6522569.1 hypothetical protein [Streptomyces sp. JJ36]
MNGMNGVPGARGAGGRDGTTGTGRTDRGDRGTAGGLAAAGVSGAGSARRRPGAEGDADPACGSFEDRLLAELQQELGRGRDGRSVAAPGAPLRRRPVVRRTAMGLAACAAAGAAVVAVPGSPAESPAYAVEQNPDGSVELQISDFTLDRDEQRELAATLREMGIDAVVDTPPPGTVCQYPRGEDQSPRTGMMLVSPGAPESGKHPGPGPTAPEDAGESLAWSVEQAEGLGITDHQLWGQTLNRGDTLIIENYASSGGAEIRQTVFSYVTGEVAPCDPQEASRS